MISGNTKELDGQERFHENDEVTYYIDDIDNVDTVWMWGRGCGDKRRELIYENRYSTE